MSKIGLMDKGSNQLDARSTVADTDRIPVYTSTGTEPELMTVSQLSTGGILNDNNAFTGNNTFAGTSGFNGAVDIGSSGTAGSLDIFPATASKGKLNIACANQTGNTTVTLNANTMGQATTINIADPGVAASFVAQSTLALSLAEVDILQGATLTTTELNRLDDSAEIETVIAAGAASTTKFNTNLAVVSGGAVTLDVCPATMVGKIKTIRMSSDDGDVTIALTNVQGGTQTTTATFDAVSEELILIGSSGGKWTVIKEFGVTLS